jgi:hypothetical protein
MVIGGAWGAQDPALRCELPSLGQYRGRRHITPIAESTNRTRDFFCTSLIFRGKKLIKISDGQFGHSISEFDQKLAICHQIS